MLGDTRTKYTMGFARSEERGGRSRKIGLDRNVYSAHSLRASGGDVNCDHDFEATPTVAEVDFAIWKCTKCGREFRYETWKAAGKTAKP